MELRKVEINNVKNSAQQPSYPQFTIVLSHLIGMWYYQAFATWVEQQWTVADIIGSHTGGNPKSPIIYPDDNSTYLNTFNMMI